MRLYAKLFLMIAAFCLAAQVRFQDASAGVSYDIQLGVVWLLGNAADRQKFVDVTERRLAEEGEMLSLYLKRKECERLTAKRIAAAAARLKRPLTQEERNAIAHECDHAVYAVSPDESDLDEAYSPRYVRSPDPTR